MTGIPYHRSGHSIINCPDLANLRRDQRLHTHALREIDRISAFIEDQDDGCGLVQAIKTTDGLSLDDRYDWDCRIWHKSRKYSIGTVTPAEKTERWRGSVKHSLCRAKLLQSAVILRNCNHCTSAILC